MTQKTKLEIIGPYTPEHEGPFCTRSGRRARIICLDRTGDFPIISLVEDGEGESLHMYSRSGSHNSLTSCSLDLMNAREVPVAREFWVNEYASGGLSLAHPSLGRADANRRTDGSFIRTIHVREVLPGEGA